MKPILITWVALGVLFSPAAFAQNETATPRADLVRERAAPRDRLELDLANGNRVEGEMRGLDGDQLHLRTYDAGSSRFQDTAYTLDDIEQFTLIQGRRNMWGFAVGALLVGGAGVWLGAELGQMDGGDSVEAALTLGILGAAAGGVLGLLLAPPREVRVVLWTFD